MKQLRKLWQSMEALFFAPPLPCGLCSERPSLPVGACQSCLDSLALSWERRDVWGYPYFSLFPYQGHGRDLIHRMKFQGGYEIGVTFGHFLALAAQEEPELAKVDVLIPVPIATDRLLQRGFNQALLLADTMSSTWKRPLCEQIIKVRGTKPQSELSSAKRKKNLQGAFRVLPGFSFKDKVCLVVDDVITSGHTFFAVAQIIEKYGGHPLGIFVARTEMQEE